MNRIQDYFINFSNHPSDGWSEEQRVSAECFGKIVDVPFPVVSADMDEKGIVELGEQYVERIRAMSPKAVMCQGEFTLCHYVVNRLLAYGIPCLNACSDRVCEERVNADGSCERVSVFRFVQFRKYVV